MVVHLSNQMVSFSSSLKKCVFANKIHIHTQMTQAVICSWDFADINKLLELYCCFVAGKKLQQWKWSWS